MGKHSLDIWNLVMLCLMWIVWLEHNRCTFEDLESTRDQLLASFVGTLFNWSCAWGFTSRESIPMFIESLSFCT